MMSGSGSSAGTIWSMVSTRDHCTSYPARTSSVTRSSASSGWSSTISKCSFGATAGLPVGTVEDHPVQPDLLYRLEELVDVHGLDHVTVGPEPVAGGEIALLCRGRQHHHRNLSQHRVLLELTKHVDAVQAGHLLVQHHHAGQVGGVPGLP